MIHKYILGILSFCVQASIFLHVFTGCKSVSHSAQKKVCADDRMDQGRSFNSFLKVDDCILTQGIIRGRELSCKIVNASTNDIVYLKLDGGIFHAISYRNREGGIVEYDSPICVGFDGVKEIGVLSGQNPKYFSPYYNHAFNFRIKLPSDCVDIISVSVDFRYLYLDEFSQSKCRSIKELVELFNCRNRSSLKSIRVIKGNNGAF